MRHVRMRILGIGLLVALITSAFSAGSALAAKEPYNSNTWGQFADCPYENYPVTTDCFYGRTAGGSEGGEFKYGHVRVKLNKQIVIHGGFKGGGSEVEVENPAKGELLEAPELAIVGGLNIITPQMQEEAEWPAALKESFAAAKKAKETKAFAKIETAGNECVTVPGCLSTENLLFEEGTTFRLALKVKVTSAWLEKLGGGPCYIGSDENPVKQNLSSAGAGRAGVFSANNEFTNLNFASTALVDVGWHISQASGANGCGGSEYETYVNHAINLALEVERHNAEAKTYEELPSKKGITYLTGSLHDGAASAVKKLHEEGNPELP